MFFLPQKPYMPLGTLRQQLLYPSGEPDVPKTAVQLWMYMNLKTK